MKRLLIIPCFIGLFLFSCEEESIIPDPMELELQVQDASAFNARDGAIQVNILQGEPPYFFHWNTGDTTRSISGLRAGDYTVKIVFGPQGKAFYQQTATVSQPDAVPLNLEFVVTDSDRFGKPQGAIRVNASGGVPPYKYLWSTGATTQTVENILAGTYSVTVTDSGNPGSISTKGSVTVRQPEFVCVQDSIRDIDGFVYSTVMIGNQCWIGENLKTIHRPDSRPGELELIDGRLCRGLFCQRAEGAHYTWHGAMNSHPAASSPEDMIQGICPTGWHLPTRVMFENLDKYLSVDGNGGPGFFSGTKMKGPDSSSGFDALFTGNWGFGIYNAAPYAGFWSSTQNSANPANARMVYVTQDTPFLNAADQPKIYGFNIRCIKSDYSN
jgi:uncharacterized protein (TIGR02145 family)